jgi:hypothetical protein
MVLTMDGKELDLEFAWASQSFRQTLFMCFQFIILLEWLPRQFNGV